MDAPAADAASDRYRCFGLWAPASDATVMARYEEFEGLPDLDVSKIARCVALDPRKSRAVDVGAHIGAVSVYLARHFPKVSAFEAVPATYALLLANTEGLSGVEALNLALGAARGEAFFSHFARHGQLSHVEGAVAWGRTERVGPIKVRTLDRFAYDDVSFIKVDVEGFELQVLQGAVETLRYCRPLVLIEQAGNEEKYFNRPRNEASAFLEDLGMRPHPGVPPMRHDRLYSF
jgi:FkbM family methyltransferase